MMMGDGTRTAAGMGDWREGTCLLAYKALSIRRCRQTNKGDGNTQWEMKRCIKRGTWIEVNNGRKLVGGRNL